MIEQELRDSLARAVATEPPLEFDPEVLVARARRQVRRRSLLAAGAATVLIMLVAVAVPGILRAYSADRTGVAARPSTSALTTGAPAASATPAEATTPLIIYTVTALREYSTMFSARLTALMPEVVPAAKGFAVQGWTSAGQAKLSDGPGALVTSVRFTVQSGPASLLLRVYAPGAGQPTSPDDQCQLDNVAGDNCQQLPRSAGDVVLVENHPPQGRAYDSPAAQIVTVADFRPDGSEVNVTGYNFDAASYPVIYLPGMPASVQQLMLLATDQGLTFNSR